MAAKKKSTGKKPVSDAVTRRYETKSHTSENGWNPTSSGRRKSRITTVDRYDRLTGERKSSAHGYSTGPKGVGNRGGLKSMSSKGSISDPKSRKAAQKKSRSAVSPKRRSK